MVVHSARVLAMLLATILLPTIAAATVECSSSGACSGGVRFLAVRYLGPEVGVEVTIYKEDKHHSEGEVYGSATNVSPGDLIYADASEDDKDKLASNIMLRVSTHSTVLELDELHVSCSQPILPGQAIGTRLRLACFDSRDIPGDDMCRLSGNALACVPADGCGNGILDPGEQCDDANTSNNDACLNDCTLASCGDGYLWTGHEQCDDANTSNNDACLNDCVPASCGDGHLWTEHEQCDDANSSNNDGCLNDCTLASCGDGYLWTGHEQCDDANTSNNDSCLNDCTLPSCGDGFLWYAREQCDDGNSSNNDACPNDCVPASCGDGHLWTGHEQCDDANSSNNDGCLNGCTLASCGDGYLWTGHEQCDDANTSNNDVCLNDCSEAGCGDGYLWLGQEQCDDGNQVSGDGCAANCTIEPDPCGNGVLDPGEICDDGNRIDGDGCDSNCSWTACGNGLVTSGEECDDGNLVNLDGCSSLCTVELCYAGPSAAQQPPATLGQAALCLATVIDATNGYVARVLRAQQKCLSLLRKGKRLGDADLLCRGTVERAPLHTKTWLAYTKARATADDTIQLACARQDLSTLTQRSVEPNAYIGCLLDRIRGHVDLLGALEFGDAAPTPRQNTKCQGRLAKAGATFLKRYLRATSKCIAGVNSGKLPVSTDCLGYYDGNSYASPSDPRTALHIEKAADRVDRMVTKTCRPEDLSDLLVLGGTRAVNEAVDLLLCTHRQEAIHILDARYDTCF